MFRHRSRPPCSAHVVQTEDCETQTEDLANESDASDLTMQLSGNAEDSVNNCDTSALPPSTKPENRLFSIATYDIAEPAIPNSLSFNDCKPPIETSGTPTVRRSTLPAVNTHLEPQALQPPFPQQVQLQNSARALKEELQQGVEDVCQKLNSFFGKPHPLPSNSKPLGYTHGKTPERSAFSLFNSK